MTDHNEAILRLADWEINMNDAWQVLWCTRYLNVTKSQLETAVNAVGPVLADIRMYASRHFSQMTDTQPTPLPAGASLTTGTRSLTRSPF